METITIYVNRTRRAVELDMVFINDMYNAFQKIDVVDQRHILAHIDDACKRQQDGIDAETSALSNTPSQPLEYYYGMFCGLKAAVMITTGEPRTVIGKLMGGIAVRILDILRGSAPASQ